LSTPWRYLGAMRKLSRQYERLGHDGGLSRIRELKNALVDRPLYSDRSIFDRWFWATKLESAEISVRQFTQDRYASVDFNRALIGALGSARSPVSVPLPAALLDLLREHGLPVNRARSLAHWYWLALLRFGQGVILVVSMLGNGLTGRGKTDRTE